MLYQLKLARLYTYLFQYHMCIGGRTDSMFFRSYCRSCRHLSSSYLAGGRSLFSGHDSCRQIVRFRRLHSGCMLRRARLWWLCSRMAMEKFGSQSIGRAFTVGYYYVRPVRMLVRDHGTCHHLHIRATGLALSRRYFMLAGQSRGICVDMRDHGWRGLIIADSSSVLAV